MARQNRPESTRYCSGCHDPISLFSGTKNIFAANLTNLQGYNEGVSCLSCHSIQKTDLRGNANYKITQRGAARVARDFLIRAFPAEHNKLSKRMYKAPEYCAACHKQFVNQEVNRVGWVQLQNQYDNWAASHWNHKGDPTDYNRSAADGKHRSHRFIAANNLMPAVLKVEGWEEQTRLTHQWLAGETRVPEIAAKWATGPIVRMAVNVPGEVAPRHTVPIRVVVTSNKVGHDYSTGHWT